MDIIIANGKGGCGKTTVATHLAAALSAMHEEPLPVALIDHDPQRSACDWFRTRETASLHKPLLPVKAYEASESSATPERVRVHDLPAGAMPSKLSGIDVAQAVLLVPVLPCAVDIKALFRYTMRLNRAGAFEGYKHVALVANRVKPKCESSELLERFMAAQELAAVASISNSETYVRAMSTGITCFDHPLKSNLKQRTQWTALLALLAGSIALSADVQLEQSVQVTA